jgi:hypothetical protein
MMPSERFQGNITPEKPEIVFNRDLPGRLVAILKDPFDNSLYNFPETSEPDRLEFANLRTKKSLFLGLLSHFTGVFRVLFEG